MPATPRTSLTSLCLLGLGALILPTLAQAVDLPKRKSGLWELTMQMPQTGHKQTMQQCIDSATDDISRQQAEAMQGKNQCNPPEITRAGNKITVHGVCKMDNSTVTTDSTFTGDWSSAYHGDIATRFDPPLYGQAGSKMSIDAKWLGPCAPGQKPGDMVMPGVGTMNTQDNARQRQMLEELMKRQGK